MDTLLHDAQLLLIALCIVSGLLAIAMIRILFLLRTNRRYLDQKERMEQQVLGQTREIIAIRQDSNAWRGAMQMQFDAFRAEASRRLEDAETRYDQAIKPQGLQAIPMTPPSAPLPAPTKFSPVLQTLATGVVLPTIDE